MCAGLINLVGLKISNSGVVTGIDGVNLYLSLFLDDVAQHKATGFQYDAMSFKRATMTPP